MDTQLDGNDATARVPSTRVVMAPGQLAHARDILRALTELRAQLAHRAERRMEHWAPRINRPGFLASAANLADWLALRETDVTPLQGPLSQLGLSSLGRLDGNVRPSIDAVVAALSLIAGEPEAVFPDPDNDAGGAALLAARRDQMFGTPSDGPATRIMVTLPTTAAADPGLIRDLVAAGTDCFRINCAHDGPEVWAAMIAHVRAAEAEAGRRLVVSMDLGGPKFRIGRVYGDDKSRLHPGARFALVRTGAEAMVGVLSATLSHPALLEALTVGATVSIDDGKLWARVVARRAGLAELEVTQAPEKGGKIKAEKGVNLPGAYLRVEALTAEDLAALEFVVGQADIVAFSFVQTVDDVRALLTAMQALAAGRALPAVLLKIETPLGLRNLPDLIVEAGGQVPVGVMIARGDLAVEIGFDRLSEIQEEILWLCEAAQVPVVWATQVLEGMVKDGQASRAEVTDAAMSQRAECVMLNKGEHVVKAVGFLRDILMRMDRHQNKKRARLVPLGLWMQEG